MGYKMRRLRDVDVGLKPPLLRAPGNGGFVVCDCFTETYRAVTRKLLRVPATAKVYVQLDPDLVRPQTHPISAFEGTEVATVGWPIDLARLKGVSADEWIRVHFEEMHAGIVHLAKERRWPLDPLAVAREAVIDSNFRFTGQGKKAFTSSDRRHRIRLDYVMDWEWFVVFAVLLDKEFQELGRKEIVRYPAGGAPVHHYLRGKSGWTSSTTFRFVSSDTWFEPRQAIVSLGDF
jgi:hypothetical protein